MSKAQSQSAPDVSNSPAPSSSAPSQPDFKVYRPSDRPSAPLPPTPPDEYFTPTAADLRAAQSQLSARTKSLTDGPLELRATREAREKAKRDKWPKTTIRIRFTDRTQLEKIFPSTDKIKSVYAFVRGSLREDVKQIKFILYQPPKRELKVSDPTVRDLSLYDLHLAPSSVLLIKFLDDSLNHENVPAPLASDVLAFAEELPVPPVIEDSTPSPPRASSSGGHKLSSSGQASGEKKIPKWLKLGKK